MRLALSFCAMALLLASCGEAPRRYEETANTSATVENGAYDETASNAAEGGELANAGDGAPDGGDGGGYKNGGGEPANTSDSGTGNTAAVEDDAFCPAVNFSTSAAQCRRFTAERGRIESGLGVFNPPDKMTVNESRDLIFAIGRKQDAAEIRETVSERPTERVEITTPIGRHMTATLSGGGFDIDPEGPQEKQVAADGREVWQWRITAKEAGEQRLLLLVTVDSSPVGGGEAVRYELARKLVPIKVEVTEATRLEEENERRIKKIERGEKVMSAAQKWVIGLTALVVALGGLWVAIRTFGKKKDEDEEEGGDAPDTGPTPAEDPSPDGPLPDGPAPDGESDGGGDPPPDGR